MDIKEYIKAEKQKTDNALRDIFSDTIDRYTQIDTDFAHFTENLSELLLRGGKRLRPLLMRLSYQLVSNGDTLLPDFVKISAYTELMHIFMLVHDDIADKDYKRYGGPTLERQFATNFEETFGYENNHFGTSLALIGGDLYHVIANQMILQSQMPEKIKISLMQEMHVTLTKVIAGWHLHFWQNHVPLEKASKENYLKGMQLVSASYTVEGPLELGLILADKQAEYSSEFRKIGYHIGMAFQMQDDILGVFGDSETTGKPSGNDIREGKKTLLVLEAYQKAKEADKETLIQAVGNNTITENELLNVREIVINTGSLEHSRNTAQTHIETAISEIEKLKVPNTADKEILKRIAQFMLERTY